MRKAAMDRSESRIVYLNMLEDDDEYSADFNIVGQQSDHSPDHTLVHRFDSNSSVDTFMPNLSMGVMPRSSSQDLIHRVVQSDPYSLDRQHSIDDKSGQNTPKRPRSATLGSFIASGGRGSPRNLSNSHSVEGSIDETEYLSPSTSPGTNGITEDMTLGLKAKAKPIIRTDSQSSGESSGSNSHAGIAGHHRQIEVLPNRLDVTSLDDSVKVKLTHRRTSGNRRYHTADAIQELRKDKDASIHKRLSWNLGNAVDISIDGERQGILKNKTFSNDSLRSMPSSSGVSSTGSLHLSPESEICEEYETPEQELSHTSSSDYHTLPDQQQVLKSHEMMTQSFNEADILPAGNDSDVTHLSQNQGRTMSKSLPDLSAMLKSDVRDGIGSVQLPSPEQTTQPAGQRRKMTQAQIWKMTALLLNSTLEAS